MDLYKDCSIKEEVFVVNEPSEIYGFKDLIYKEEAYSIISCCFEVLNILGKGFLESVYKDALMHEFKLKNILFVREKKFEITYKSAVLQHHYYSDFIVYDKIVLEIKAQNNVINEHYRQLINYLALQKA